MCNFFVSPLEYNIQITRQKIISWEKWILRVFRHRPPYILHSPASAPHGQRRVTAASPETGSKQRVPILFLLDILWLNVTSLSNTIFKQ